MNRTAQLEDEIRVSMNRRDDSAVKRAVEIARMPENQVGQDEIHEYIAMRELANMTLPSYSVFRSQVEAVDALIAEAKSVSQADAEQLIAKRDRRNAALVALRSAVEGAFDRATAVEGDDGAISRRIDLANAAREQILHGGIMLIHPWLTIVDGVPVTETIKKPEDKAGRHVEAFLTHLRDAIRSLAHIEGATHGE
ncbi:MAG: hypothetical protein AAF328_00370 [Planctomycetota bacterium]